MIDFKLGDTLHFKFTTRSFSTGAPTTLSGSPVISAYEDNSVTQISGAAVAITADFDGVTGLNHVTVTATGANGFESGKQYDLVVTTGTVGGVSVVGEVVASFGIEKSAAVQDLANGTDGLGALRTLILDVPTVSEFNARTLLAADYFDPATDTVANVTSVSNAVTLPLIPAGWITFAGISAGALIGKGDWNIGKSGYSISGTKTTLDALNDISTTQVNTEVDTALTDIHLDHLLAVNYDPAAKPGISTALLNELVESDVGVSRFTANALEQAPSGGGGGDATAANQTTILGHLTDIKGGTWSGTTDSLEAIRDRGDSAWITGGGGGITQILNVQPVIPTSIDVANTSTVRVGLILINSVDDLPTAAEITPGTISIDRKSIGATTWSSVLTDAAMFEQAGMVYFDEVFDAGSGYAEGDSIRLTFKSVSITADANTHVISDSNGIMFQTEIRQTMRGTDGANTTTPPTVAAIRSEIDTNSTQLTAIVADTNELQGDWANGGRLNNILDARASQTTANNIETDTQNIQNRIPAALISGKMDSDARALDGDATAATRLKDNAKRAVPVTFSAGSTTTGTIATLDGTTPGSNDDYIKDAVLIFSAPAGLKDVRTTITAYNGTTKVATVSAVPTAIDATAVAILV